MTSDREPRLWARICDLIACALVALWLWVALFGGFRIAIAGQRLGSITSPWRVLLWAAVIAAIRHIGEREAPLPNRILFTVVRGRRFLAPAAYVAVVVLFLSALAPYRQPTNGFTLFIGFGDRFAGQALPAVRATPHYVHPGASGYDGQFYAQLAIDPLLTDPALRTALDEPSFRARRVLFSWSAFVFGAGKPYWILQVYAVQNIVCWLLLAWLLLSWFPPGQLRHFCSWFACLFSSGMIFSVLFALPDGPSLLLVAVALKAVEQHRHRIATIVLGLAGLARETSLPAAAMLLGPGRGRRSSLVRWAVQGCIVIVPLLAWTWYVQSVFKATDAGVSNIGLPFIAFADKWKATVADLSVQGWGSKAPYSLYALIGLTVQALYLARRAEWENPVWRVGAPYVVLLVVLGPAVWAGDMVAATRVLLPLTFAFNVLVVRDKWWWPISVLGNLPVLQGLAVLKLLPFSDY